MKSIIQKKILSLLFVVTSIISNTTNGQPPKSDFENKIDNYIKLYSPNFDITDDKSPESGKQFSLESLNTTNFKKYVTLKSKQTIQDKNGQTVNLRLYFSFYSFDDSKLCKDAMNSLLNCFGGECGKIELGVAGQSAKTTPCVFIFNENQIISCQIICEQENNYWQLFKPDLIKTFSNSPSDIVESGCGGPITFVKK